MKRTNIWRGGRAVIPGILGGGSCGCVTGFGLGLLLSASLFAASGPPPPPGMVKPLLSPRAATIQPAAVMQPPSLVIPATNAPAMLVLQGWYEFQGDRVPRVALRFRTNAPAATIYTLCWGTNWQCWTTLTNVVAGTVREFSWCPTPALAGRTVQFKVVLHD